ncbi:MAG TPA: hypothetical protein PLN05_03945 [Pyrinomonadaceae bacterium]|nr:hypothetical protein [Blastocatellia bacterium]HRJ89615.1 hypothetical protein [Pyrinomonadaceae bacterium]HRK49574.1 hypothetical protein [Pyrinomonadaceae bacterium]
MAKQQFRLAIGSPSKRQSGIWRIWSIPKGDIYVANRCLGGIYKASFHKDRKCQFGFTKEYAEKADERFGRNDRHIEKWRLPEDAVVCAIQILIPESELRISASTDDEKITWLETPPLDSVGTISLFITEKDIELHVPRNVPGAVIVGRLDTDIRRAWITYAFTIPDKKLAEIIEFEKHRLKATIANMAIPPGTRASLWDSKNSYDRHVLELACDIAG